MDPLRLTLLAMAITVILMPLIVLPFIVVMNDPSYVGEHRNGRVGNGVVVLVTILGALLAVLAVPLQILGGLVRDLVRDLLDKRILDRKGRSLGRVLAQNGRPVGRVEEIRVERSGAGYVVAEYHVGPEALLERLAISFQSLFRNPPRSGYAIAWNQVDLSDPERPRLTCPVDELRTLGPADEQEEPGAAQPRRRAPKGEG